MCFIDDKDDMDIYRRNKEQMAEAVADAIAVQFGLEKNGAMVENGTREDVKEISTGSKVIIKDGAIYGGLSSTRGKAVPAAQRRGKEHTVDKLQTNKGVVEARLAEIKSWVAVSSLKAI